MAVNWHEIRTEYVNGNISLRKLAEKVGVSYSQIAKVAASERWKESRENQGIKIELNTNQKTQEKISDALSDEAAAKARIRAKLIRMAENWIDSQGDTVNDTGDFRRMVQSCLELGIMNDEADKEALAKLDEVLSEIGGVI